MKEAVNGVDFGKDQNSDNNSNTQNLLIEKEIWGLR